MSTRPYRASAFHRWGAFTARRRWLVAAGAFAGLAAAVVLAVLFSGSYDAQFRLPGTESSRGATLLRERFPAQAGRDAQVVFAVEGSVHDGPNRAEIEAVVEDLRLLPGVVGVQSPFDNPTAVSDDGRIAFATLYYPEIEREWADALVSLVEEANSDTLTVEAGGDLIEFSERHGPGPSELIAVGAAAVILLLAFGSVVAMGLPILTALIALGASIALLGVLARFMGMTEFTPTFGAMIGLGVGIDYALLIVTRFRERLHHGDAVPEAVATTMDTAGRSVLFAGTVVIIAMLGLLLMGIPFIAALGVASALVVLLSVTTALTLLPATLALVGRRIDALRVPFLHTDEVNHDSSLWYRLSLKIQRYPFAFAAAGAGILLVLAIPVLDLDTGFTDAGNNQPDSHSRRAYDLLTEGFGPGFNGPLLVVVDTAAGGADTVEPLTAVLAGTAGVARVGAPRTNPAGDATVFQVYPETSPQDNATGDLIRRLRGDVIPPAVEGSGAEVYVTGGTALTIDLADRITSRTPYFFAMVIGLSMLVLAALFRSVVIPVTAALMNLLSIAAAYGVMIAIFQWGWGAEWLGIQQTGPIETFLPMMMFAILFGLSMDYEVFLVSRIREEHLLGYDNSRAVAMGLSSTARVISSAALIMIAVFGSFALQDERVIKEFGIGLAVAIFLDATVVRLLLVPAIMEILGRWNWWLPAWLGRLLPAIHIESPASLAEEAAETAVGATR